MALVPNDPPGKKHLRCGACGKLSRPDNFVAGAVGAHALDAAYQEAVPKSPEQLAELRQRRAEREGDRRGGFSYTFAWSTGTPSREDLALQLRAARAVVARIEGALGVGPAVDEDDTVISGDALRDPDLTKRDFARVAKAYIADAEAELELRRGEVEREIRRRGWDDR